MAQQRLIAQRPGFGKAGTPMQVNANFLEIKSFGKGIIHHYDIKLVPEVPAELGREVFQALEAQLRQTVFQGSYPVYDGKYNLFSPVRLNLDNGKGTFEVYLPRDQKRLQSAPGGKGPKPFQVNLSHVAEINLTLLHNFVAGRAENSPSIQSAINALDLAFHQLPASQYPAAKNSFYTPQGKHALSGGMEVWSGLFQSVRPTLGRLLLNVDVSSTAFYSPGSLLTCVTQSVNKHSPNDLLNLREADWRNVHKMIKGMPVTLTHRVDDTRVVKVKGLSNRGADNTMFNLRNENGTETKMSVLRYFTDHLRIQIRYPSLPCVELKRGAMVPLELCQVVAGHRVMRKLDERQTAEMIKFTCVQPQERFNRIRKQAAELLKFETNPYLKAFGIQVSRDLLRIGARQLPPPVVVYGKNSREMNTRPRDGSWNMREKCFVTGAKISSYGVLVLDRDSDQTRKMVGSFMQQFDDNLYNTGVDLVEARAPIVFGHFMNNIEQSLAKVYGEAKRIFQKPPQIIYVFLSSTASAVYGDIKRISDTRMGIVTQCMQLSKIRKPNNIQYMANVALKVNVKLGGINSHLEPKQTAFLSNGSTMVIGADVTHPAPGNSTDPSIAAVVGSVDNLVTRFISEVSVLPPRTEVISNLCSTVNKMLQSFRKINKNLPRRILFYRDGVSESQFQTVLTHELAEIKKAAVSLYGAQSVPITFITCQKRHHVRFCPTQNNKADRSGNCPAGTVVDREVTHPKEFDFYLQSQGGLQGTSRPTRYVVLHDDNKFSADDLQQLTNQMCYLFPRCTRSVSLCPPVYFADLLAARARYHRGSRSDFEDSASLVSSASTTAVRNGIQLVPVVEGLKHVLYFM
ncbi:hypothetical protein H4R33_002442 [Dimargaris cristalligena]|nr:hypothetical protein H4R33_002442 [Dimargaris cristalligena]